MDPELLVGFAGAIGAGKNAAASSIPRAVVIEHADPIAQALRGHAEHAPELAATEQAQP